MKSTMGPGGKMNEEPAADWPRGPDAFFFLHSPPRIVISYIILVSSQKSSLKVQKTNFKLARERICEMDYFYLFEWSSAKWTERLFQPGKSKRGNTRVSPNRP